MSYAKHCKGLWWLLLLVLPACRGAPAPLPLMTPTPFVRTLHIGLTSTATTMTDLVTQPYAARSDDVRIQFVSANTETLFADLDSGLLDAILVHHIPDEATSWFSPVAVDGVVIAVHPQNQVNELTRAEVRAIFGGQVTNWSTVGGPEREIEVISRERGSGARAIFVQGVMDGQPITTNALVASGDRQMQLLVSGNPAAIGYRMMGSTGRQNFVALDDIVASPDTTAGQSYPLTVPLYFAGPEEPTGALREFLAWLQSAGGQTVLGEKYGRVR